MTRIFENIDCMEGMKSLEDNHFDLAIVDPPYGIKAHKFGMGRRKGSKLKYKMKPFDNDRPNEDYFKELIRVSKNQVIWGGQLLCRFITRLKMLDNLGQTSTGRSFFC